jgi:hypothetical protein
VKNRLWLKRTLWGFAALILATILTLSTIVVIYKDDIIAKAVQSLQENLKSKSSYSAIDISVWSSFPLLAVDMQNIWIEDAFQKGDTLLHAKQFSLAFDWLDALSGRYDISKITLDQAQLNLIRDKKGRGNWDVFKEMTGHQDFQLGLKKLKFKTTKVRYWDARSDFFQETAFNTLALRGNFSDDFITIEGSADGQIADFYVDGKTYVHDIAWQWDGDLSFDQNNQVLNIEQGDWEILDSPISITGWLDFKQGKGKGQWKSESIKADRWIAAMPPWLSGSVKSYNPKGVMSISGQFEGSFAHPQFHADLFWKDGELLEPSSGVALENLELQLDFDLKDGKDRCTIRQLQGDMGGGNWKISGTVSQTESPDIDLKVEVNGALSDIHDFLKWDTLTDVTGNCNLNSRFVGKVQLLEDSTLDWQSLEAEGNLALQNVGLGIKGLTYQLKDLNAVVQLHEGHAIIHQWVGKWGETDFDVSGRWNNVIDYFAKGDALMKADLNIQSQHVLLDNWIIEMNNTKSLALPYFSDFNIHLQCGELLHKDFKAQNISADLELDRKHFQVNQYTLQTAGGKVSGNIHAALLRNNDVALELTANSESLDIQQLMHEFRDFSQEVIKEEQLKGRLNAELELQVNLAPDWSVKKETIQGFVDLAILDGEIIEWKLLSGVADYLKRNKWIAPIIDEDLLAEKLRHVKFKSLKNILAIQNGWIDIPWMEINTSALNMVLKARHSLNNEVDYLMGFHVRDLLLRDPNAAPTENGKKFFISMKGPWNGLVFKSENDEEWKGWVSEGESNKKNWKDKWKESLFKMNPIEFVRERGEGKDAKSRLKPRLKIQPPAFLRGRKKDE